MHFFSSRITAIFVERRDHEIKKNTINVYSEGVKR